MAFRLHPEAEKAHNSEAKNLLQYLTEVGVFMEPAVELHGSLKEKPLHNWTGKIAESPRIISSTFREKKIEIFHSYLGLNTGFNEIGYPKFEKFVKSIYKNKAISKMMDFEFVYDNAFKWLIATHQKKTSSERFIDYLKLEVEKTISTYKYSFRILDLDIDKKFQLGNVIFDFLSETDIEALKGNKSSEELEYLKTKLQGNVYATIIIEDVQRGKGAERALEECYKALNVLKLFCKTIADPEIRTTFDIDKRVTTSESSERLIQDMKVESSLSISLFRESQPLHLDASTIDSIIAASKNFCFLIELTEPNELQRLLLNGIEKFSEAISHKDIHRRIVDLFTIWESLFLKNDSVNIQDSLIFFGRATLMVAQESYASFGSYILSMYDIRSHIVHHANKKDLDLKRVTQLQYETVNIIESLTLMSGSITTKAALLKFAEQSIGMSVEDFTKQRTGN